MEGTLVGSVAVAVPAIPSESCRVLLYVAAYQLAADVFSENKT
jgi:hypothetical protein